MHLVSDEKHFHLLIKKTLFCTFQEIPIDFSSKKHVKHSKLVEAVEYGMILLQYCSKDTASPFVL